MEVFSSKVNDLKISNPLAVTIGNFDGIHLGHQKLLENLILQSKKYNLSSCLISFNPHPIFFFKKNQNYLINLESTKIEILNKIGLDFYVSIFFDDKIANFTSDEFEFKVLSNCLNTKLILSGLDFRYGKNRVGDVSSLQKFSKKKNITFSTQKIVNGNINSEKISSSSIRSLLKLGDVKSVKLLLGRSFETIGKIIKGDQRGRTIGIPTANILYNDSQVKIAKGVYAVKVLVNNEVHNAIANYGIRPTFNKKMPLLEVHILNFDKNIYDQQLKVQFQEFIRNEIKFESIEQLLNQIKTDISKARKILDKNGH